MSMNLGCEHTVFGLVHHFLYMERCGAQQVSRIGPKQCNVQRGHTMIRRPLHIKSKELLSLASQPVSCSEGQRARARRHGCVLHSESYEHVPNLGSERPHGVCRCTATSVFQVSSAAGSAPCTRVPLIAHLACAAAATRGRPSKRPSEADRTQALHRREQPARVPDCRRCERLACCAWHRRPAISLP